MRWPKPLGRFTLPLRWIEDGRAKDVLRDMIVVRAEMLYHTQAIEYVAMSDWFAPIPEGEVVPVYVFTMRDDRVVGAERAY